ncbi:MAG TPA: hypothetical protein VGC09_05425 [Rhodopila sp.]
MILVFEMIWPGVAHAVTNSTMIQTIARGFPEQTVRVFAEASHLQELHADPVLLERANVSLHPIAISPHFIFRPQIVSLRRGLRELWTLCRALGDVPRQEPCLIMLLSATPTAIFAASFLARVLRRPIRVQVGMHGNLNDAFGWRTRNPAARAIDLRAALSRRHGGRVRFLVLEHAIKAALSAQIAGVAEITDVLPLPINQKEAETARPSKLARRVRIGLVGQATEAKGIVAFLSLARQFRRTFPGAVTFHLVGTPAAGLDPAALDILDDPKPYGELSRPRFLEALERLDYVCLPLQPIYYGLSASGALIDAITWLKPIIATPVPIVVDLFARFGDIGILCADHAAMVTAIESLVRSPDQDRYDRQVANLRRIRAGRLPAALATDYRAIIERGFPGFMTASHRSGAVTPPPGRKQSQHVA